jgi:hypothetical protein
MITEFAAQAERGELLDGLIGLATVVLIIYLLLKLRDSKRGKS